MNGQTEEIVATLKEILKWIRIQAQPVAKSRIEATLSEPAHRRLYQALDGEQTQGQLAASSKTSQPTVSRLVSSWVRAGIVEEVSPGRYMRIFDLGALGIDLNPRPGNK
jgi:DNA-binding transcriptional ArsR family regulator